VLGAPLIRRLRADGIEIVNVPANRTGYGRFQSDTPHKSDDAKGRDYVGVETALGYPHYLRMFAAGQSCASAFVDPGCLPSCVRLGNSLIDVAYPRRLLT
jgi:hypothetical protein